MWDGKSLCNGVWARQFYHWLCPSFFKDHMAVNYLRNLKLVRLSTIRAQDDFLVRQMLLSNGLPFLFSDRSWSWSSPLCHGWLKLEELQRFWPSSFNKPSPLLPYQGVVAFYLQVFFSQVYLICFYISPSLRSGVTIDDFLFLLFYISSSGSFIVWIDPFYHFVVYIQKKVCRIAGNSSNCAVQNCSLYVERSLGITGTCIEDWMVIFYTDPRSACLQTASVDPLIAVFSVLCLAQSSIATFWTCCVGHVWEYLLLLQPLDKTKATEGEDLVNTEPPSLTMLAVLFCFLPMPYIRDCLVWRFFHPQCLHSRRLLEDSGFAALGTWPWNVSASRGTSWPSSACQRTDTTYYFYQNLLPDAHNTHRQHCIPRNTKQALLNRLPIKPPFISLSKGGGVDTEVF